jgi:hypothetical protein
MRSISKWLCSSMSANSVIDHEKKTEWNGYSEESGDSGNSSQSILQFLRYIAAIIIHLSKYDISMRLTAFHVDSHATIV